VAVLLSFLWLGAGHLYLDRVGTGVTLMAAHFVLGILLLVIFAPLGFLVWLAAFITCAITCSNLAGGINAGTVPPTATW
jgi:TM2 domain-containing membrane protein YozV